MDCNNCYDLIVIFFHLKNFNRVQKKKNQKLIMGATKVNAVP